MQASRPPSRSAGRWKRGSGGAATHLPETCRFYLGPHGRGGRRLRHCAGASFYSAPVRAYECPSGAFNFVEEGPAFFNKMDRTPLRASVVRQRRTIRRSAPREVFSATYTPPPKMIAIYFAAAAAKLCEAFLTDSAAPLGGRPGFMRIIPGGGNSRNTCCRTGCRAARGRCRSPGAPWTEKPRFCP